MFADIVTITLDTNQLATDWTQIIFTMCLLIFFGGLILCCFPKSSKKD